MLRSSTVYSSKLSRLVYRKDSVRETYKLYGVVGFVVAAATKDSI